MKNIILISAIALLTALSFSNAKAPHKAHWGYQGKVGPSNWAQLSPEYSGCTGQNQSPVNLTGFIESDLAPIAFHYEDGGNEIINNGHTVQVNYDVGSYITVDGVQFNLAQFHFHAPSENHINGKSYPLEAHLVHQDRHGNLAVVAVMFTEGAENEELAKTWSYMPKHKDEKHALSPALNVSDLLPENRDHYRFNGSLTTPPCSEGVRWFVMKSSVSASKAQIETFSDVLRHPNNRPLQAINARSVMQ
ncbi:MAG: carbonic anhydrase family protein [Thiotrichaceae bacterium]